MAQKPHALEHTNVLQEGYVFHYTCNPPKREVLDRLGIKMIGEEYGCNDPREVLLIPERLYHQKGYSVHATDLTIVTETLLRRLDTP